MISALLTAFCEGRLSRRGHIEALLNAADITHRDDASVFLAKRPEAAVLEAMAWDTAALAGLPMPSLAGIGVSVKACIDVSGLVTTAGSRVLADRARATANAPVVERIRQSGGVVLGHTNMTEFAYSGLGVNPHYGTPRSPFEPMQARVAGGSTSGGAVSVALGSADVALGTDTSGSVRIPAAFCGLTGFKPSRGRYPIENIIQLAPSFDVPGIIGRTVDCCRLVDEVLAQETVPSTARTVPRFRLLIPTNHVLDKLDPAVQRKFDHAVTRLQRAGIEILRQDLPELGRVGDIARQGGIVAAESYAWHRKLLDQHRNAYDPRVASRILSGATIVAADYVTALATLRALAAIVDRVMAGVDALAWPTVPILPPRLADLGDDAAFDATNGIVIRNTEIANRLDLPSLTLPLGGINDGPVGLLITGRRRSDALLLQLGLHIESVISE